MVHYHHTIRKAEPELPGEMIVKKKKEKEVKLISGPY